MKIGKIRVMTIIPGLHSFPVRAQRCNLLPCFTVKQPKFKSVNDHGWHTRLSVWILSNFWSFWEHNIRLYRFLYRSLSKTWIQQKSVEYYGQASRVISIFQSLPIPSYSLICGQSNMQLLFAAFIERTTRSIIIPSQDCKFIWSDVSEQHCRNGQGG